jgi:hypothetical protein
MSYSCKHPFITPNYISLPQLDKGLFYFESLKHTSLPHLKKLKVSRTLFECTVVRFRILRYFKRYWFSHVRVINSDFFSHISSNIRHRGSEVKINLYRPLSCYWEWLVSLNAWHSMKPNVHQCATGTAIAKLHKLLDLICVT